jgi:hypothetical protein
VSPSAVDNGQGSDSIRLLPSSACGDNLIGTATNTESHIDLNAANKHKVTVAEVRGKHWVRKARR